MTIRKNAAFTLLEVLLVVALITVIAGISIPAYQSFQNRNDLDIAASAFAQSLRRAQTLSQAVDDDTSWGVFAQNGSITIFKGAGYATRDTAFDEVFDISPSLALSGTSEYIFSKFTGEPSSAGSLVVTSINNETRTITTNTKGMVSY